MSNNVDRALAAYVECALWSSVGEDGEPLDGSYGPEDLAGEALEQMRADVADFLESNADVIGLTSLSPEQVGHDFWLTRNRHGAGFWDRGLGEAGEVLTDMAHPYGSCDLCVGDDGLVYVS